jgi:hypothetical protein
MILSYRSTRLPGSDTISEVGATNEYGGGDEWRLRSLACCGFLACGVALGTRGVGVAGWRQQGELLNDFEHVASEALTATPEIWLSAFIFSWRRPSYGVARPSCKRFCRTFGMHLDRRDAENIQIDRQEQKSAHADRPHHQHQKRDTRQSHRSIKASCVCHIVEKALLLRDDPPSRADIALYRLNLIPSATRRNKVVWLRKTSRVEVWGRNGCSRGLLMRRCETLA